jgi:hypothetical protein
VLIYFAASRAKIKDKDGNVYMVQDHLLNLPKSITRTNLRTFFPDCHEAITFVDEKEEKESKESASEVENGS